MTATLSQRTIACAASGLVMLASCSGGGSTSDTAPGPTLDASKIAAACF